MRAQHIYRLYILVIFLVLIQSTGCEAKPTQLKTGAEQTELYIPLLKGKQLALVVNQSSIVERKHLIDTLLTLNLNVKAIFAPEHGLRGNEDAGALISDGKDAKTGLPVYSLHGKTKKPLSEQLKGIDVVVFDMQDVGVRFFTYISTMHYVMEACAENNKTLVILDRPNPLGFYVDGPVLRPAFRSFVGMHPIPVIHGLTVGELALMINGEGWLAGGLKCDLRVIQAKHWDHTSRYTLPVKPSPNLPNQQSILLYPSLCFFEATDVSIGRGTLFPFQVIGYPHEDFGSFCFTPEGIPGMSMHPKHKDKKCYGVDLRLLEHIPNFTLSYLLDAKSKLTAKGQFITRPDWFNLLAGNDELQNQILDGMSEEQIRKSWEEELKSYKEMRKKYLLYADFE